MNVAVVGCGVRGATLAALLAGAGVEDLALVDGALVTEGDLGMHPLQFTPDVGSAKPDALVAKLGLINPRTHAQAFPADLTAENAAAILAYADCVADCTSDAAASAAIEAAAGELAIPVVAPPTGYSAGTATAALAAAVGALQADLVLGLRRPLEGAPAGAGGRGADATAADTDGKQTVSRLIRVEAASIPSE